MPENLAMVSTIVAYFWMVSVVYPLMAGIAVFGKTRPIGLLERRPVYKHSQRRPWMHSEIGSSGHGKSVNQLYRYAHGIILNFSKVGNSSAGIVESPLWSYQLGIQQGWMPLDPRVAIGSCGPSSGPVWDGTFESWMTGGADAGTIVSSQTALYPWPPTDLQGTDVSILPYYTSTGSIATLPAPTFTDTSGKTINSGDDGWFNVNDNAPGPTPIPGCAYPDPWNAVDVPVPTGCSGGANAAVPAIITPPPSRR